MIKLEDTTMRKAYNQPAVNVTSIALESMVLAGSPGNTMELHTDIPGEQW